jgi:predicted MFS family arabinose efflux permease
MSELAFPPSIAAQDEKSRALSTKIGIIAAGFCSMLNLYAPQAILPRLAQEFGVAPALAALTITATTIAVALFAPFAGVLSDRVNKKKVVVLSLVCLSVPTALSGLSNGLNELLLVRFLQGIFMPAAFAASLGYISENAGKERIGAITSLYISANVSGGFAGRLLGGVAADLADWHWSFYVLAVINLSGACLVGRFLPAPKPGTEPKPDIATSLLSIVKHIRTPQLLAVYLVGFNVLFALVTVFTYVNFHLSGAPFHLSSGQLGLVFCVYLVGIVVTPSAGKVIDRIGQRRTLLFASIAAVSALMVTLVPDLLAVIAGLALFCSAIFICQASATSQIGKIAGRNRSSAAGLYLTFYYGGGALGAALPGLIWQQAGWTGCVILAVLMQVMTASVAWKLFKH